VKGLQQQANAKLVRTESFGLSQISQIEVKEDATLKRLQIFFDDFDTKAPPERASFIREPAISKWVGRFILLCVWAFHIEPMLFEIPG
jgi:hypothetical protein